MTKQHQKHAIRLLNGPAPGAPGGGGPAPCSMGGRPSPRCRRSGKPRAIPGPSGSSPCCRCGCRGPGTGWHCAPSWRSSCGASAPARSIAGWRPSRQLRTRRYGRTKPGTLLKHPIPLKTDRWDVAVPGFTEIDLVAHCGSYGDGEFVHSLNVTDIHTTWVETAAVLGKGQGAVQTALEGLRQALPFELGDRQR